MLIACTAKYISKLHKSCCMQHVDDPARLAKCNYCDVVIGWW